MRLFFSVPIDVTPEFQRLLEGLSTLERGIKATRPANLHLTLKFFGEIKEAFIPKLTAILQDVVKRHHPFEMTFDRIGYFPSEKAARVVWIGIQPSSALESLVDDLNTSCALPGFEVGKEVFRPHVTLARCQPHHRRTLQTYFEALEVTDLGSQHVSSVQLSQSDFGESRVVYKTLAESALIRH